MARRRRYGSRISQVIKKSKKGLSGASIAGIVVGLLLIVAIILLIGWQVGGWFTKGAGSSSKAPGTTSKAPGTTSKAPGTTSKTPGTTSAAGTTTGPSTTTAPSTTSTAGDKFNNDTLRTAVSAWIADPTSAEATYGHISTWDTSEVTDMSQLFYQASAFNDDISAWKTNSVMNMYRMFFSAKAFNQDISGWNTSSVTNMAGMFTFCSAFSQDIGAWDISSVTNYSNFGSNSPLCDDTAKLPNGMDIDVAC